MSLRLVDKIEKARLIGRGGAGFPLHLKWRLVESLLKSKPRQKFYLVINAAEGEPGVKKDAYILANELETFLQGVSATVKALGQKRLAGIYCFINRDYYQLYANKINKLLKEDRFLMLSLFWHFTIKPRDLHYISGEETAILNIIEGKRTEPRLKPPLPIEVGLFGQITLVNNVETFFNIALVANGSYEKKRFYTVGGDISRPGVYFLPDNWMITDVLRLTGNWPSKKFFVQVGGDACGEILNSTQLDTKVSGSASITVYNWFDHNQAELLERWLAFYSQGSCGKCTPCREGTAKLYELHKQGRDFSPEFWDILELLNHGSFCAYGKSLSLPLSSYYKNILKSN